MASTNNPTDSSAEDSSTEPLAPELESLMREVLSAYRNARLRGERPNRREMEQVYPELGAKLSRKLSFIDRVLDQLHDSLEPTDEGELANESESERSDFWDRPPATYAPSDLGSLPPSPEVRDASPREAGETPAKENLEPSKSSGDKPDGASDSHRLECPQCGHAIRIVQWVENGVTCIGCGSSFRLGGTPVEGVQFPETPKRIGKFLIEGVLGRGSFGTVFRARDTILQRTVAIKIPHKGYFTEADQLEQFRAEARSAACLNHPRIVKVYEIGIWRKTPFLVTEFIDGHTLEAVASRRKLGYREVAELMSLVCEAIHYAHASKVLHRDIKPSNILLDQNRQPYITDFGLARADGAEITITMEGQIIGTPAYMSPEQARGADASAQSDVFSLGVMLYRLLTGEIPFRGSKEMTLRQVVAMDPRKPRDINDTIPRDLEVITLKAMSKQMSRRYDTASDMAEDLKRWLEGRPIIARPAGRIEQAVRWCQRNCTVALLLASIAALLLLLLAGLAAFLVREHRLRERAEEANLRYQSSLEMSLLEEGSRLWVNEPLSAGLPFAKAIETRNDQHLHRERLAAWRQSMPLLTKVWDYGSASRVARVSRDGRYLAVGGSLGVTVWDLDSLESQGNSLGPAKDVVGLEFDPQGRRLAVLAKGERVTIRNVLNGELLVPSLSGTENAVEVAWSPQWHRLAVVLPEGGVEVWDAVTGQRVGGEQRYHADLRELCFAPDGEQLFVALGANPSRNGLGFLIDGKQSFASSKPILLPTSIRDSQFSLDGRWLAICTESGETQIRNAETLETEQQLPALAGVPQSLRFTPNADALWIACADGGIHVWDCVLGRWRAEFGSSTSTRLSAVAMDPRGKVFAACGVDGVVSLWNTDTLFPVAQRLDHHARLTHLELLPDARRLVTVTQAGLIRVWDLAAPAVSFPILPHEASSPVRWVDDGRLLVTATGDHEHAIRNWRLVQGKPLPVGAPLRHPRRVRAFDMDPRNQQRLVSTCDDGKIRVWNRRTMEYRAIDCPEAARSSQVKVLDDGQTYLVWGGDSSVVVGKMESSDYRTLRGHGGKVETVVVSPDLKHIAVVAHEGVSRLWELDHPAADSQVIPLASTTCASFHPGQSMLLLGAATGKVAQWEYEANRVTLVAEYQTPLASVNYDPSGERSLMVTSVGDVYIRTDATEPRRVASVAGRLITGEFDVSGRRVLLSRLQEFATNGSESAGGELQVWDPRLNAVISRSHRFPFVPSRVAVSPDHSYVACSGEGGQVYLLPWQEESSSLNQLLALAELYACQRYGENDRLVPLTSAEIVKRFQRVEAMLAPSRESVEAWEKRLSTE